MHTDTLSPEPGGTAVNASLVPGAEVSVRRADQAVGVYPWASVPAGVLAAAAPWRVFRWYQGQQHYSGRYWSSTQRDHVIHESRLELAVLLLADFDRSVRASSRSRSRCAQRSAQRSGGTSLTTCC
jgi:hypothetical protein